MEQSLSERFLSVRRRIIDDFFIQMNPMQRQAVYAVDGPVLILAGAGSGKTTVIINRIANMIQFGDAYTSAHVPEHLTEDDVVFLEEYAAGESWDMDRAFSLIRNRTGSCATVLLRCWDPWPRMSMHRPFIRRVCVFYAVRLSGSDMAGALQSMIQTIRYA